MDRRVGERIRRRRILLGITQDQLADALGISYQQVQKYETGANRVSAGRLAGIAAALDIQAGWFFGESELAEEAGDEPSSRLVMDLVRNFSRIRDERIKANVLSLVRSLADASVAAAGPDDGDEVPGRLRN